MEQEAGPSDTHVRFKSVDETISIEVAENEIESPEPPPEEETKEEPKNKPKTGNLYQQTLPAWQPIPTAAFVIPFFGITGAVCVLIGTLLTLAANGVFELKVPYTHCNSTSNPLVQCKTYLHANPGHKCYCNIKVEIKERVQGDVYFYYGLRNFNQNHRRYYNSRNEEQYYGRDLSKTSGCKPLAVNETLGMPYAPCGEVANSLFNDTFELIQRLPKFKGSVVQRVPLTHKDTVWSTDYTKHKNPGQTDTHYPTVGELQVKFRDTLRPPNWGRDIWDLDPKDNSNNGFLNSDFINWMRIAGQPNFRKLYRKLNRTAEPAFYDGLPMGNYTLRVGYLYEVSSFGGSKYFIISTTSWAGAKNGFLGISYLVVGSILIVTTIAFLIIHWKFGKPLDKVSELPNIPKASVRHTWWGSMRQHEHDQKRRQTVLSAASSI